MRVFRLLPLAAALLIASGCDTTSEPGPPVVAEILRVTVLEAPLFDPADGSRWDGSGGGGPEVYFRLFDDGIDFRTDPGGDRLNPRDDGNVIARLSNDPWYDDVDGIDLPLIWDVDEPYIVRNLRDPLYVALFDYDSGFGGGDDPMGETEVFILDDFAPTIENGSTQIITLDGVGAGGDDIRVSLTVIFRD